MFLFTEQFAICLNFVNTTQKSHSLSLKKKNTGKLMLLCEPVSGRGKETMIILNALRTI